MGMSCLKERRYFIYLSLQWMRVGRRWMKYEFGAVVEWRKLKYLRKTCPNVTFSTTNPTWKLKSRPQTMFPTWLQCLQNELWNFIWFNTVFVQIFYWVLLSVLLLPCWPLFTWQGSMTSFLRCDCLVHRTGFHLLLMIKLLFDSDGHNIVFLEL
jgi:hypothetical protein